MPDLLLVQNPTSLKWTFQHVGSDVARTVSVIPSVLRLLVQGSWLGDDGERAGDSLADLSLSTSKTVAQIQRIVESRLSVLIQSGRLVSATVLRVTNSGDKASVDLQIVEPGQQPQTIQVPLTA